MFLVIAFLQILHAVLVILVFHAKFAGYGFDLILHT